MKQNLRISYRLDYLNLVFLLLAISGMLISGYVFQSFAREAPAMCVGSGCDLVRNSPESRIFGIPVPAFGFVGYFIFVVLAAVRIKNRNNSFAKTMTLIALGGSAFVTWFTYIQLAVIHGTCVWCLLSGLNMYLILFLSLLFTFGQTEKV